MAPRMPSFSILRDRLRVLLSSMRYREAWTLSPRLSLMLLRYLLRTRPAFTRFGAELNAYSPPVGSVGFGRYLRGLKRVFRGDVVPLLAHVSITDRCPYHCARCSNPDGGGVDPSLADLETLFDGLRKAGTARVALTGGEPLLRRDLPRIVEACSPDLAPLLFTAGPGLDRKLARDLEAAGLAAAFVSLDHFSADEHDRIRGERGAFEQAVGAIRACLDASIYTAAQAVVEPTLFETGGLESYFDLCRRLEVDEVMLLEPVPVGKASPSATLGDSEKRTLADLHLEAASDASLPRISTMSFLESPGFLGCQAGFSFLYVHSSGDTFPCDFAPCSFGNVYEVGIDEILRRLTELIRRPSRACLSQRVRGLEGSSSEWPLSWERTRSLLSNYEAGPPPGLMRHLRHASFKPSR